MYITPKVYRSTYHGVQAPTVKYITPIGVYKHLPWWPSIYSHVYHTYRCIQAPIMVSKHLQPCISHLQVDTITYDGGQSPTVMYITPIGAQAPLMVNKRLQSCISHLQVCTSTYHGGHSPRVLYITPMDEYKHLSWWISTYSHVYHTYRCVKAPTMVDKYLQSFI